MGACNLSKEQVSANDYSALSKNANHNGRDPHNARRTSIKIKEDKN